MPELDQRLDHLTKVRANAEAALRLSKEKMKEQYKRDKKTAHFFNIGDLVWLQAKDIKIHQKSPKLGPCQLGSFKVIECIGDLCRSCTLFFAFLCLFLAGAYLPQRHTHGCHMDAMLKPRNCLAAPTAPVSQAGSPGIWLPACFGRSLPRRTFPIKVM
jgi:hypothetical protein